MSTPTTLADAARVNHDATRRSVASSTALPSRSSLASASSRTMTKQPDQQRDASAYGASEAPSESRNDELLLRCVLARAPFATNAPTRMRAWCAIVDTFVAAGGARVTTRAQLTRRLAVLTRALLERPHELTPTLRGMVLTFHERNCRAGFAAQLGTQAVLKMLRAHATDGRTSTARTSFPSALSIDKDVLRKKALEDTLLLQLLLQLRPFEAAVEHKASAWQGLLAAYSSALADIESVRSPLASEGAVLHRVRSATTALLSPDYTYHTCLTPTLRVMLLEFAILSAPCRSEMRSPRTSAVPQPMSNAVLPAIDTDREEAFLCVVLAYRPFAAPRDQRKRQWDAIADAVHATSGDAMPQRGYSAAQRVKRLLQTMLSQPQTLSRRLRELLLDYYEQNFKVSGSPPALSNTVLETLRANVSVADATDEHSSPVPPQTHTADDVATSPVASEPGESLDVVLLRTVLCTRFRPGHSEVAWQRVAEIVNDRAGNARFASGTSCKRRIEALLVANRDPVRVATLRPRERTLLEQLDHVLQSTTIHLHQGKRGNDSGDHEPAKQRRLDAVVSVDASIQELASHYTALARSSVAAASKSLSATTSVSPDALAIARPAAEAAGPFEIATPVGSTAKCHGLQPPLETPQATAARIAELETEVSTLREALSRLSNKVDATEATDVTTLLAQVEDERCAFRDYVTAARDAQRREAQVLLDALARERDERRHELAEMANVLKRSAQIPEEAINEVHAVEVVKE